MNSKNFYLNILIAGMLVFSFFYYADACKHLCLQRGSEGVAVQSLQAMLQAQGLYKGAIDGKFGSQTEQALKAFQRQNLDENGKKLVVDGILGIDTTLALRKSLEEGPNKDIALAKELNDSFSRKIKILTDNKYGENKARDEDYYDSKLEPVISSDRVIGLAKSSANTNQTQNDDSTANQIGMAQLINEDYRGFSIERLEAARKELLDIVQNPASGLAPADLDFIHDTLAGVQNRIADINSNTLARQVGSPMPNLDSLSDTLTNQSVSNKRYSEIAEENFKNEALNYEIKNSLGCRWFGYCKGYENIDPNDTYGLKQMSDDGLKKYVRDLEDNFGEDKGDYYGIAYSKAKQELDSRKLEMEGETETRPGFWCRVSSWFCSESENDWNQQKMNFAKSLDPIISNSNNKNNQPQPQPESSDQADENQFRRQLCRNGVAVETTCENADVEQALEGIVSPDNDTSSSSNSDTDLYEGYTLSEPVRVTLCDLKTKRCIKEKQEVYYQTVCTKPLGKDGTCSSKKNIIMPESNLSTPKDKYFIAPKGSQKNRPTADTLVPVAIGDTSRTEDGSLKMNSNAKVLPQHDIERYQKVQSEIKPCTGGSC